VSILMWRFRSRYDFKRSLCGCAQAYR